jgi:hypothetical protein
VETTASHQIRLFRFSLAFPDTPFLPSGERVTAMWKKAVAIAIAVGFASAIFVRAESITIKNGSFENPTTLTDTDDATGLHMTPDYWTKAAEGTTWCGMFSPTQTATVDGPGKFVSAVPNGDKAIWGNQDSYFYQVLDATLQANTKYTFTVYAGARSNLAFSSWGSDATIDLGYGSTYGANLLSATNRNCPTPGMGEWKLWTATFVTGDAPAGLDQNLRVEINIKGTQQLFDGVELSAAAVPEPSTLAALVSAAFGLLAYAWRQRK